MFGDGGDDRNVNLRISGIPERVKAAGPRGDNARNCEEHQATESNPEDEQDDGPQKDLELLARDLGADVLDESDNLKQAKDAFQLSADELKQVRF